MKIGGKEKGGSGVNNEGTTTKGHRVAESKAKGVGRQKTSGEGYASRGHTSRDSASGVHKTVKEC